MFRAIQMTWELFGHPGKITAAGRVSMSGTAKIIQKTRMICGVTNDCKFAGEVEKSWKSKI